jgi:hypothetical protein
MTPVGQSRSSQRLEADSSTDEALLVNRMLQLASAKPQYGHRRIGVHLRKKAMECGRN